MMNLNHLMTSIKTMLATTMTPGTQVKMTTTQIKTTTTQIKMTITETIHFNQWIKKQIN